MKPGTRVSLPRDIRNYEGKLFQHAGCQGTIVTRNSDTGLDKVRVLWDNNPPHSPTSPRTTNIDPKYLRLATTTCAECGKLAAIDDYLCVTCREAM